MKWAKFFRTFAPLRLCLHLEQIYSSGKFSQPPYVCISMTLTHLECGRHLWMVPNWEQLRAFHFKSFHCTRYLCDYTLYPGQNFRKLNHWNLTVLLSFELKSSIYDVFHLAYSLIFWWICVSLTYEYTYYLLLWKRMLKTCYSLTAPHEHDHEHWEGGRASRTWILRKCPDDYQCSGNNAFKEYMP